MDDFISEDDLQTFEGWLSYQGHHVATMTTEELATWRAIYTEVQQQREATPKVGLMKLRSVPGEHLYAVTVREGDDRWLVLWVRRSSKGEFFVMKPIRDPGRDIHTSYHRDGSLHMKSHKRKVLTPQKRQPLTGPFTGFVDLGVDGGFSPKGVGAIYDPTAFSGVVEVASGVLGPVHGAVAVALVEPGHEPPADYYTWAYDIVIQKVFAAVTSNVVITVLRQKPLHG